MISGSKRDKFIKGYMIFFRNTCIVFNYISIPLLTRIVMMSLMIFALLINAHAEKIEPLKITLAAEDGWPPFADQVGSGISHNLIKQAFQQVNVEVSTIVVPYSRGLIMTERGSVDGVFNVTREQSTVNRFVFGNVPLFTATASFFFTKDKPVSLTDKWQIPINSVVGIIEDYEYGDDFLELVKQRKLHIIKVDSQRQLINLLLVERIDAAIMYDLVADVYIKQMGVKDAIYSTFNNHTSEIFVAFSKKNPQSIHLSKLLDEGLLRLKKQGKYDKLLLPPSDY